MNISNSNVKVKIQFAVNCIYYYFSELFFQATRDILDNCVPPTLWQQFQEDPHTCGVMIQSKYFWPYSVLWVIKCRALDPKTSLLIIFILNQIPAHLNVYFAHLVMHYYCDLCTTHLYSPLWMYWKGNPNSEIYIYIYLRQLRMSTDIRQLSTGDGRRLRPGSHILCLPRVCGAFFCD